MHTFYSTPKCYCRYSDLDYNMFDMLTIIGNDMEQKNKEILHDLLKCRNIEAVDDLLNVCFQLSNGFWVVAVHLVFKVAPLK